MRFPLATLVVNVAGCLIIGVLAGLVMSERIALRFYWREFLFVGILGGFTTFSTFGLDTDHAGADAFNGAGFVERRSAGRPWPDCRLGRDAHRCVGFIRLSAFAEATAVKKPDPTRSVTTPI